MSYAARGGENANSALLASVTPEDSPEPGPLGGMLWQEQIEQACFRLGGADYHAPAQLLGDFLAHRPSAAEGGIRPTYRPGVPPVRPARRAAEKADRHAGAGHAPPCRSAARL